MGWDDNGLPTERRVENYYGVRCDPSLPYDPAFEPPEKPAKERVSISRPNFVELCRRLTARTRSPSRPLARARACRSTGASSTRRSRPRPGHLSAAFLRGCSRAARSTRPRRHALGRRLPTAVSQAELEDRERPGAYHRIAFARARRRRAPSRSRRRDPSCSPACVALVAHPDDARYQPLFGTRSSRRCSASRCRSSPTSSPIPTRARASR
jgi:valyl-tRNA synthetase